MSYAINIDSQEHKKTALCYTCKYVEIPHLQIQLENKKYYLNMVLFITSNISVRESLKRKP